MGTKEEVARLWSAFDQLANKCIDGRMDFATRKVALEELEDHSPCKSDCFVCKTLPEMREIHKDIENGLAWLELQKDFAFVAASAAQRKLNCELHGKTS